MSEQINYAVEPLDTIGNETPRVDAIERVTGQALYTRDQRLPGMLYARILRSRLPHARILSIDTSRAEQLEGVVSVITHENAQVVWGSGSVSGGRQYNDPVKDVTLHRRYIFNNPVRFVGEPVDHVPETGRVRQLILAKFSQGGIVVRFLKLGRHPPHLVELPVGLDDL